MSTGLAIGIDLGTTNSAISIWRNGKVEMIPNALGKFLTPSVVSIDEHDVVLVGEAAKSRLVTRPKETAAIFKRFMGSDKSYRLSGKYYSPSELSALVLGALKQDAEAYLGESISDVVISVPAYFNDQQRKHVRHAAELAALNAVRLINEPTAACLAYSVMGQGGEVPDALNIDDGKFLVFDLGGGTFDITVVEFFDSFIEVHASTGNNQLGGEDFTQDLVDEVLQQLDLDRAAVDLETLSKIIHQCEQAKCRSSQPMQIELGTPFNTTISLMKSDLQSIWQSSLEKLSAPLKQALRDANLSPDDVDNLIFVGGATKLPEVQQIAARLLGRFGSSHLDPDLVVCMGAAIQAGCRLRDMDLKEIILTDVCPYSLGISAIRNDQSGVFCAIIERNTVVPTSRVERFFSVYDNQKKIDVSIYQGERLWAKDNVFIDKLEVDIPASPAGREAVDVRFSYDINGLLDVDVTVVSTGQQIQKIIDQTPTGLSEEEKQQSLLRLSGLKEHPRDSLPNITLLEKLHSAYEQSLKDTREYIGELIFHFTEVLDSQDENNIRKVRDKVEKALHDTLKF